MRRESISEAEAAGASQVVFESLSRLDGDGWQGGVVHYDGFRASCKAFQQVLGMNVVYASN